jgi:fumarylpyruvate hydrolase
MIDYLFHPAVMSLPVNGSDARFPVRRIYCVARNYRAHAAERGAASKDEPFFFCKQAADLVQNGSDIPYPPATKDLQPETELVLALGQGGEIYGQAVGFDLTRRDVQDDASAKGRAWCMGKSFEAGALCGPITPLSGRPMAKGNLRMVVNGRLLQNGDVSDMIWPATEIVQRLAEYVTPTAGDLIFTGTPAGMGPVQPGDRVFGEIEGLGEIHATIVGPAE